MGWRPKKELVHITKAMLKTCRAHKLHQWDTVTTWSIWRSQRKQPAPGTDEFKKECFPSCVIRCRLHASFCSFGWFIIVNWSPGNWLWLVHELPSILHTVIAFTCDIQEKSRIMWSCSRVSFESTPFEVVWKETSEYQFGPHYFKKRESI